jgi:nucleoside-diphosphate-sugar epimerase
VPNNIYGITKLLGERLTVWAASKFGLDYTILRLTNVYGPEGDQYNLQAMIQNALTKGTIRILGGTQRMNFIYVEDVAEAVQRCTVNPQASRQTFNVGSEDSITVLELAKRIASFLQRPVHLEYAPMREGETSHFQPSLMKIQKTLGFTSQTSLEEGLKKTVKWYISDSKP